MASYRHSVLERVEFEEVKVAGAPLVVDDWTLAFQLGFRGKVLWAIVNDKLRKYTVHQIQKSGGGMRTIHAPTDVMKLFLRQLRSRILLPLVGKLGPHVCAYQVGKSTRDAAVYHLAPCPVCAPQDLPHSCKEEVVSTGRGKYRIDRAGRETCSACAKVVAHPCPRRGVKVHLDLKEFFGSTRRAWVRRYFHEEVGYNHYVSSLLAACLCVELRTRLRSGETRVHHGVPQGSPASGDICNLVADVRLDQPLLRVLEGSGWRYSRYADDLYFSHAENLPREEVDRFLAKVAEVVRASGYRLNQKKSHVQRHHRRQQVLGVVVNQKANIPRDRYDRLRAIVYNVYRNGFAAEAQRRPGRTPAELGSWIQGQLSYMAQLNPHKVERLKQLFALARAAHPLPIEEPGLAPEA